MALTPKSASSKRPHLCNDACDASTSGCAWVDGHLCDIDCGLAESGCTLHEIQNTSTGDVTSSTITAPNTVGYMQVLPPVGKNNYRVEYKLGDEVKVIWVDADGYTFEDNGICSFYVDSTGTVFSATHVYSVTWVKANAAESPAPYFPPHPFPAPAPWAPTPPFLPPYRIGDFPPFPYGGTITVWSANQE